MPHNYLGETENGKRVVIWERRHPYSLKLKVGQRVKIHRDPTLVFFYRDFIESAQGSLAHVIISWF